ncbi:MAG: hypothetical protein B6D58_05215 [candidate division Zixibacteria bacterium 4484_95]|nr:MAG: hypothetical protein B6D58_05215 [candidate division Zixibacteria bacterium 4484_95]
MSEINNKQYQIVKSLGKGGMGEVFEVVSLHDGSKKALKLLHPDLITQIDSFKEEFKILTQLRHPFLVRVYDFGIDMDGRPYFTMDYMPGGDISTRAKNICLDDFYRYALMILSALDYIHSRGLIHGDLKPSNILIDELGNPRLVDFGMATHLKSDKSHRKSGTLEFISPEVLSGDIISPKSDLYSLGLIFFELLFDKPLLEGTTSSLLKYKLEKQIKLPDFPGEKGGANLRSIIARLLENIPENRYKSAGELIQEITELSQSLSNSQLATSRDYFERASFCGRKAEIDLLKDCFNSLTNGHNFVIYISGESGVGKSRLVEQFKYDVQMEGTSFIQAGCNRTDNQPLAVISRLIEQVFTSFDSDYEKYKSLGNEVTKLFPELFPQEPSVPDFNRGKQRLFDNLFKYIETICEKKRLVLVIEDLQWADSHTIEFLNYICEIAFGDFKSNSNGFMLVITSQIISGEPEWKFISKAKKIALGPAGKKLWREFLSNLFGDFKLPEDFTEKLYHETGGNFLFAEELLKSLTDNEVLYRLGGYWYFHPDRLAKFPLPVTVREAISRRLSRLGLQLMAIVEHASVLENLFKPHDILSLSGFEDDHEQFLDELVRLRVFKRQNGDFQFSHNQIREVAYELIPHTKRMAIHCKAARYFEKMNAKPEFLARQYFAGGDRPKAYKYLCISARNAVSVFGWAQAADYYEQILKLIEDWPKAPRSARFEALREKAKSLMYINPKSAQDVFIDVLALVEKTDDPKKNLTEMLILQAENYQHLGDNEQSRKLYKKAFGIGKSCQVSSDRDNLLGAASMGLGFVLNKMGKLDQAGKWYLQALDYFINNPEKLCQVLSYLGVLYRRKGDLDGALDYYNRSLKVCQDYRYKWPAMYLYGNIGNVYAARSDYQEALDFYQKSLKIALEISDRRIEGVNLLNIGHSYNQLGHQKKALDYFNRALVIQKAVGDRGSEAVSYNNLGETYLHLGQFKRSFDYYNKGLELARSIKEPRIELANLRGVVDVYLIIGELTRACEDLKTAQELAEKITDREQKNWALTLKAEILYEQDKFDEAEKTITEVLSSEPEDVGMKARLLVTRASIMIKTGNMLSADKIIRDISGLSLSSGFKSTLHRIKSDYWLQKGETGEYLKLAEKEILQALRYADLYGPAREKPVCYVILAKIKKIRGNKTRSYITKAENFAREFCAGFPEDIQSRYLKRFKLEETLMVADQEESMEKSIKEKRLETLFEVAKTINSILELDPLLNQVMDLVLGNLRAERGFIMLKDNKGNIEPVVARNLDRENIPGELTISRSTIDDVFESSQPLIINWTPEEKTDRESVADFQITSILCAPLKVKNQVIGIVYIDNRFDGRIFDKSDLDFLVSFCHLAAIAIENARLTSKLTDRNVYLQKQVEKSSGFGNIIGRSSPMQKVFRMAESVAATEASVVISGESGTGKEVLARAIHFSGPRKNARFIPVDCGALPESLLESELFGHKRGAFTSAISDRQGLFEVADGGTVFLDEITNTSQNFQVKLLRIIQEGEYRRVGDTKARRVNVRIITATNKDLKAEVENGNFREDLYYRLNVVNIHLPALRDRKEDIPILTEYFLENICKKMNIPKKSITSRAIDYLVNYRWPGNIRQLENAIERMVIFSKGDYIDFADMPQEIRLMFDGLPANSKTRLAIPQTKVELKSAKAQLDRLFLVGVMKQAKGNVMKAAKISGIDRTQLHHMLNKYNIDVTNFRGK